MRPKMHLLIQKRIVFLFPVLPLDVSRILFGSVPVHLDAFE